MNPIIVKPVVAQRLVPWDLLGGANYPAQAIWVPLQWSGFRNRVGSESKQWVCWTTTREVDRMDELSTSIERIWNRFSNGNLLIPLNLKPLG
jgi:hypothetical protein